MLVLCSLLILFLLLIVLCCCCCCSCCVNFPLVAFYFVIFYFVAAFLAALQTATAPDFVEFRARLNACLAGCRVIICLCCASVLHYLPCCCRSRSCRHYCAAYCQFGSSCGHIKLSLQSCLGIAPILASGNCIEAEVIDCGSIMGQRGKVEEQFSCQANLGL